MFLVPADAGATYSSVKGGSWWGSHTKTGDNSREAPYGHIYPRVTTKSNVYTVHMRVQTLRKAQPATNLTAGQRTQYYTEWHEGRDQVLSEYRGSTTIERYIDPADPNIPDFAVNQDATMDEFYRFRVVNSKRFAP
jgi:hypothetical protein